MADNLVFINPLDFGLFDMSTSQTKALVFKWDTVVIPECKAVFCYNDNVVKTYTDGDGLVRSNGDLDVTLTVTGSDFVGYEGQTLDVICNFFVQGDEEISFKFRYKKGKI